MGTKLKRSLQACFGCTLLALGLSWMVGKQLVAPYPSEIGSGPIDLGATSVSIPSESGSLLAGWHLRAKSERGVLVLLHGKGGSRRGMLNRARVFLDAGYSILMIDFRAHGESPGRQVTLGYLEQHDARAAVEFARKEHPGEPIGVLGVSLGGAAALLASPLNIDALVLEAVFPDIRSAVHNRVAFRLGALGRIPTELLLLNLNWQLGFTEDDLRPIEHMPRVGCPVFVLAGQDDAYTTAQETAELFAQALEPKQLWLLEGVDHRDLQLAARGEYNARLLRFFAQHLAHRD
jgi:alpha-beta hydrolase superfamily lysophospholipase